MRKPVTTLTEFPLRRSKGQDCVARCSSNAEMDQGLWLDSSMRSPRPIYSNNAQTNDVSLYAYTELKRKQTAARVAELEKLGKSSTITSALVGDFVLIASALSGWFWFSLLFAGNVPMWLQISQPIITALLFTFTSDTFSTAIDLHLPQLSGFILLLAPLVNFSALLSTTGLLMFHLAYKTLQYGSEQGKLLMMIMGLVEGIDLACGCAWYFVLLYSGVLVNGWLRAAVQRRLSRSRGMHHVVHEHAVKTFHNRRQPALRALSFISQVAFALSHYAWIAIVLEPFNILGPVGYKTRITLVSSTVLLGLMTCKPYLRQCGFQIHQLTEACPAAGTFFWSSIPSIAYTGLYIFPKAYGLDPIFFIALILVEVMALILWIYFAVARLNDSWAAEKR